MNHTYKFVKDGRLNCVYGLTKPKSVTAEFYLLILKNETKMIRNFGRLLNMIDDRIPITNPSKYQINPVFQTGTYFWIISTIVYENFWIFTIVYVEEFIVDYHYTIVEFSEIVDFYLPIAE